jgi:prepilin-type N-terminal cleavage/methylation domain-containing protein
MTGSPPSGGAGFTLTELSVALLLVGTVGSLALGTYALVSRSATAWQSRIAFESDVHLTMMRVLADLRSECGISTSDASCPWGSTPAVYTSMGDTLARNGRPMTLRQGVVQPLVSQPSATTGESAADHSSALRHVVPEVEQFEVQVARGRDTTRYRMVVRRGIEWEWMHRPERAER